jgi:hypothetical protein
MLFGIISTHLSLGFFGFAIFAISGMGDDLMTSVDSVKDIGSMYTTLLIFFLFLGAFGFIFVLPRATMIFWETLKKLEFRKNIVIVYDAFLKAVGVRKS